MRLVPLNTAVMFGKATDEWATPREFFMALDAEFGFGVDAAARDGNALKDVYLGPDHPNPAARDALVPDWREVAEVCGVAPVYWCNPPYSRCAEFVAKAAEGQRRGVTTVMLIPSRTDTRYWHAYVWDQDRRVYRPGVEVRFVKGRLKFGDSTNSAPFPSVVIVFRPVVAVGAPVDAVDPVEPRSGDRDTTGCPRATDLLPCSESA